MGLRNIDCFPISLQKWENSSCEEMERISNSNKMLGSEGKAQIEARIYGVEGGYF